MKLVAELRRGLDEAYDRARFSARKKAELIAHLGDAAKGLLVAPIPAARKSSRRRRSQLPPRSPLALDRRAQENLARRLARSRRARRRDRLSACRRDDRVAPRNFHRYRRHGDLAGVRVLAGRLLRRRANRRRPSGKLRLDRPSARLRVLERRMARRADAESFICEILRRPCHRGARARGRAGAQAARGRSRRRHRSAFQRAGRARDRSAIRAKPIARSRWKPRTPDAVGSCARSRTTSSGKQVASPLLSACSDPTLDGYGHYRYDHEGTPRTPRDAHRARHLSRVSQFARDRRDARRRAQRLGARERRMARAADQNVEYLFPAGRDAARKNHRRRRARLLRLRPSDSVDRRVAREFPHLGAPRLRNRSRTNRPALSLGQRDRRLEDASS